MQFFVSFLFLSVSSSDHDRGRVGSIFGALGRVERVGCVIHFRDHPIHKKIYPVLHE